MKRNWNLATRAFCALSVILGTSIASAGDRLENCDGDDYPDSIELAGPTNHFNSDFETNTLEGWTTTGLWHVEKGDACAVGAPTLTPTHRLVMNRAANCDFDIGSFEASATSPSIVISKTYRSVSLKYYDFSEVEGLQNGFDFQDLQISVNGGPFTTINHNQSTGSAPTIRPWGQRTFSLNAYRGNTIRIRYRFSTQDAVANDFRGWYIDDIRVEKTSNDCNEDLIPDECQDFIPRVHSSRTSGPNPTKGGSLPFEVSFTTGVNIAGETAFRPFTTGVVTLGVVGVSGDGDFRDVRVNNVGGNGTLRMDVLANGTITDVCHAFPLTPAYSSGNTYLIDNTAPNPGRAITEGGCSGDEVTVAYSGATDITAGGVQSGLESVELLYKYENGPWTPTGMRSTSTSGSFDFVAMSGHGTYAFATRATDLAGNVSALPIGAGDDSAFIDLHGPEIIDCPADFTTTCNTNGGYNLFYTPTLVDDCDSTYTLTPANPIDYGTHTVTVHAVDSSGNTSECSFDITVSPDQQEPVRMYSTDIKDGYVREPDLINLIEGTVSVKGSVMFVGDVATNFMTRGIMSFDTSVLPPEIVITGAKIRLTRASAQSGNPVLGSLRLDMGDSLIGETDFVSSLDYYDSAAAFLNVATPFDTPTTDNQTVFLKIDPARIDDFNRVGPTQFRVRYDGVSDHDGAADYIAFHSGEAAAHLRPELILEVYNTNCFEYPIPPTPTDGPYVVDAYGTPDEDGNVTESHWSSEVGSSIGISNPTAPVGDTAQRQEQRLILSFDTSSIPADATITSAELTLYHTTKIGNFASLGNLFVEIRNPYLSPTSFQYGASTLLETIDFQSYSHYSAVATLPVPSANSYTSAFINPAGLLGINKGGKTQLKVHFQLSDNGNSITDQVNFATMEIGPTSPARPRLTITYSIP